MYRTIRNRKETFELLEERLRNHAEKITVHYTIPKRRGPIQDGETDWLTEAINVASYVLNNLEEFESRYREWLGDYTVRYVINEMFELVIENDYDDKDNPTYSLYLDAIADCEEDEMETYWRIFTRKGYEGVWHGGVMDPH